MAIRIPTSDQSKIFLGSQEIGAVYVGANKVWPDAPLIDPNAFIMRISVLANIPITIPFFNEGSYNGTINWKDGSTSTITSYNDADLTHTYSVGGIYDIELTGSFPHIYFNATATDSKNMVQDIVQWGNVGMTSLTNSFWGCTNLKTVAAIPATITSIGDNAFNQCINLTSVILHNSITSIGLKAFVNCQLLSTCEIPSSVTSIGGYAFYNCRSLTSFNLASISSIPEYCFYTCVGLLSIDIPSTVISIGSNSFYGCSGLLSIVIPASVTSISASGFQNCTRSSLVVFANRSTPPSISGTRVFDGLAANALIKVPSASVTAYKTATNWAEYASKIVSQ